MQRAEISTQTGRQKKGERNVVTKKHLAYLALSPAIIAIAVAIVISMKWVWWMWLGGLVIYLGMWGVETLAAVKREEAREVLRQKDLEFDKMMKERSEEREKKIQEMYQSALDTQVALRNMHKNMIQPSDR
jgi:hypothetical protein